MIVNSSLLYISIVTPYDLQECGVNCSTNYILTTKRKNTLRMLRSLHYIINFLSQHFQIFEHFGERYRVTVRCNMIYLTNISQLVFAFSLTTATYMFTHTHSIVYSKTHRRCLENILNTHSPPRKCFQRLLAHRST